MKRKRVTFGVPKEVTNPGQDLRSFLFPFLVVASDLVGAPEEEQATAEHRLIVTVTNNRLPALADVPVGGGRSLPAITCIEGVMPPTRKETCDCGLLEAASKEPDNPIRWDERLNEYYIAYGKGGWMMVRYCPFCGGRTPESRRASFFAHVTEAEKTRIYGLFHGIRTVADVVARFGPPDEEREFGLAVQHPERDATPARGEVFRSMVYKTLSPVADIYFAVGTSDSVQGQWVQKYVGNSAPPPPPVRTKKPWWRIW